MSRTKLNKPGGDQKCKAERRAAKAEARAKAKASNGGKDTEMVDAVTEEKKEKKEKKEDMEDMEDMEKKQRREEKAQRKATKEEEEEEDGKEKRQQKEENAKRKAIKEGKEPASDPESPEQSSKKRKRTSTDDDLEIDITAPEPPSKKALRKLKKHPELVPKPIKPSTDSTDSTAPKEEFPEHSSQARSKFGIWIGNLAFSATPAVLEDFLAGERSGMSKDEITRINLPLQNGRNKGFAYVDFKSESAIEHALSLSESLMGGRRVLIKNAKDFSKRPAAPTSNALKTGANLSKNPPSRILYVGNLEFSCIAEHLRSHFLFAGNIQKVRLATFEDTGKCKGFGFVDFEDKESVKRAMLGLTPEEELTYEDLEGKAELALHSLRKKRAILNGRPITMEYGQDPSVRYKKRFGGKDREGDDSEGPKRPGRFERKPQEDTRPVNTGAVYSRDAVRRTGAITEGTGKKMSFDE